MPVGRKRLQVHEDNERNPPTVLPHSRGILLFFCKKPHVRFCRGACHVRGKSARPSENVTVQPMASCYGHQAMQNHFVVAWCMSNTKYSYGLCSVVQSPRLNCYLKTTCVRMFGFPLCSFCGMMLSYQRIFVLCKICVVQSFVQRKVCAVYGGLRKSFCKWTVNDKIEKGQSWRSYQ